MSGPFEQTNRSWLVGERIVPPTGPVNEEPYGVDVPQAAGRLVLGQLGFEPLQLFRRENHGHPFEAEQR